MKRKPNKLFALFHDGKDGPFHSHDYPKVWEIKAAAKAYRLEISMPKRLNYRIVEFVEGKPCAK